jgi:tetratricopeptide (TPR) repeat protein
MVTQLYTAPIRPYPKQQPSNAQSAAYTDEATVEQQDKKMPQPSQRLAAQEESEQNQAIKIDSIITDFNNTMNALGVPESVKQEVEPYLKVVIHQASSEKPSSGLIKQNLKASANILDTYIGSALNQPSHVVREWVDALLMQNINFRAEPGLKSQFSIPAPPPLSDNALNNIGVMLQDAKKYAVAKEYDQALTLYQNALNHLPENGYAKPQAQALYGMAKIYELQGHADTAKLYYEKASQAFNGVEAPALQSKIHGALGAISQKTGDITAAGIHLNLAVSLAEKSETLIKPYGKFLGQLATVQTKLGQLPEAKETLEKALIHAQEQRQAGLAFKSLSLLGQVAESENQPKLAMGYYKQWYESAKASDTPEEVEAALTQIASVYLKTDQPLKALKALQLALKNKMPVAL